MLHLNLESKTINEEKHSTSTSIPVKIKLTQINEVVGNYTKHHELARKNSILPYFILDRIDHESSTIQQLRQFIPFRSLDEQEELDPTQLFELAVILSKARWTRDTILSNAIKPLIEAIGQPRLEAAKKINQHKQSKARAVILFHSLCQIPNEYIAYIASIYAFENNKFEFSPENIQLIQENPARIKVLYHQIQQSKNHLGNNIDPASAVAFFMFFTQQVRSNSQAWINNFVNQLIAAAIKHEEHMLEVVYALAWLTNHGIGTAENINIVTTRPEDLSYFPEVGFSAVREETSDTEFNQKLFQFALEEGSKRRPLRLFDQAEMKEVKDEDPLVMPKLTRS